MQLILNPLSPTPENGQTHSNPTFRQLLPTNCLSVFDRFVELALKGLKVNICHFLKSCFGKFRESQTIVKP